MSVNRVCLIGNLGKEPEIKHLNEGVVLASFSLATTEKGYTTKAGVQTPDKTEWHNIVAWNGIAKVVESYLKKGMKVYVEGSLKYRTYEDSNGIKKTVTEIYATNIEFMNNG